MTIDELRFALALRANLGGRLAPAKGPRGIKRRSKKRRIATHSRTLARNSWRSYFEQLKKEAS